MLDKATRIKIYKKARKIYKREGLKGGNLGRNSCKGMCFALDQARRDVLRKTAIDHLLERRQFPEYFSYKPKTGWARDSRFWWSVKTANGAKRLAILDRLCDGLSKGE